MTTQTRRGFIQGAGALAATMALPLAAQNVIPIRVANLGTATWGTARVVDPTGGTTGRPATFATIVGWWLPSGDALATTDLPPVIEPGSTVDATVGIVVPRTPGVHTLVLDLVTPDGKSLMAAGIGPTLVRITVVAPR